MEFENDFSLKEWAKDKPLSILQLDPADRAVLRIAGWLHSRSFTIMGWEIPSLEQLLAKKRKLLELRNKVISQGQIKGQVEVANSRGPFLRVLHIQAVDEST
ncbi:unnamed protein product [Chrysodeixis includens]|uniref:Uncharacterized protein n=1 Tax=Chrysodeixis includens TaxID=689277 RepID=A0A9N8KVT2_CHRIL|nr:unnamed protein product [Chrysodeixis includens]